MYGDADLNQWMLIWTSECIFGLIVALPFILSVTSTYGGRGRGQGVSSRQPLDLHICLSASLNACFLSWMCVCSTGRLQSLPNACLLCSMCVWFSVCHAQVLWPFPRTVGVWWVGRRLCSLQFQESPKVQLPRFSGRHQVEGSRVKVLGSRAQVFGIWSCTSDMSVYLNWVQGGYIGCKFKATPILYRPTIVACLLHWRFSWLYPWNLGSPS